VGQPNKEIPQPTPDFVHTVLLDLHADGEHTDVPP
jgi:hypothetical protein